MKTRHLLLAVILAAYTALGVAYSLVNPILEAPDENLQFEFVRYLVNEGRLPVYRGEILPMRQEASQPPLYYALGALISGGVNTAEFGLAARVNPHASIGIAEGVGNRNFFAHGPDREQPFQGTALAMHLVRWLSVALGAGTVLCTFLAAELLFPERPALAVAAAALNAFTPGFVFIASAVNNDNLAALAASAAMVLLLKARQAQWRWPWLVGLGAALGAASLSKLNALGAIPAVGLAMAAAFAYENRGRPWGAWLPGLMRAGLIVGLTALAVGGWWYVRNYLLYGDLLASRVHFDVMAPHAEPPSVARLLSMLDGAFKSWWGVFGWFNIVYPPAAYQFFSLFTVTGVAGFGLAVWRERRWSYALLAGWAGLFLAELVGWAFFRNLQGRLLYPAVSAVSLILARGLAAWLPERWSRVGLGLPLAALGVMTTATPWLLIAPSYAAQPPLSQAEVAALPTTPAPVYEDVFQLRDNRLPAQARPGDTLEVWLAWDLLHSTADNESVFVQILDPGNNLWSQDDSWPQNGARPTSFMLPGAVYPDTHYLDLPDGMPWCNCFIIAGLYNFDAQARLPLAVDGQPTDVLTLGEVQVMDETAPGVEVTTPEVVFADGLHLRRAVVGLARTPAGRFLNVALYWESDAAPAGAYTVFVHLTAPDGRILARHDGVPGGGRHPTTAWSAGQTVVDIHALELPSDLAGDELQVRVGLSDPLTGVRLRTAAGDEAVVATVSLP